MSVVVFDFLLVAIGMSSLISVEEQECTPQHCGVFYLLTLLVLVILALDVALRVIVMGLTFFKAPLNVFEFLVVVGSVWVYVSSNSELERFFIMSDVFLIFRKSFSENSKLLVFDDYSLRISNLEKT